MEGRVSALFWRGRRGYKRLKGSGLRQGQTLTRVNRKNRFSWKVKIKRKLKLFKFNTPKKFFTRLRDKYVQMMLRMSSSRVFTNALGQGGSMAPATDYDKRLVLEIYRAMKIQGLVMSSNVQEPSHPKTT
ncbi:hypothetical protein ACHQM5_026373 [Ranunculus cassubicifolius]